MLKTTQEKVKDKLATRKSSLHLLPDCGDGAVCHCVCVEVRDKSQFSETGLRRSSKHPHLPHQALISLFSEISGHKNENAHLKSLNCLLLLLLSTFKSLF